uniref:Uncharacterized protein LOC113785507 n=1 Tax=Cicer arietinum TaxID=3827 RepID=A0A3Q7X2F6_CICAR|nr:uncharacterized protein LOC113785507 [Cicer arietinum]
MNKRPIDVKWVYKLKLKPDGQIARYKSRLVAKGFLQKHGLDYDEVFAPVARIETVRMVVSIASYKGLKQAPRAWNKRIDRFLIEQQFEKCVNEHGVYVKKGAAAPALLICLYVDDLLLTGSDEVKISEFKFRMEKEFEMTDLDMLAYFLGIEFETRKNGIFMHQKRYASDVLKMFKMQDCNGSSTPSESGLVLSKEGNDLEGNDELIDPTTFKKIVGSLRYLCNTRPDISYSVGMVSRYMEKSRTSHYMAAKRILRYIKETIELELLYSIKLNEEEAEFIGFTDADWCGDMDDRKSTIDYVFTINNSPISWCSKKQSIVALSTCEAEYVAASRRACQAVWMA